MSADARLHARLGLALTALQRRKSARELESSGEFGETSDRLERSKQQAQTALDTAFETGKFDELFHELEQGEPEADAHDGIAGVGSTD